MLRYIFLIHTLQFPVETIQITIYIIKLFVLFINVYHSYIGVWPAWGPIPQHGNLLIALSRTSSPDPEQYDDNRHTRNVMVCLFLHQLRPQTLISNFVNHSSRAFGENEIPGLTLPETPLIYSGLIWLWKGGWESKSREDIGIFGFDCWIGLYLQSPSWCMDILLARAWTFFPVEIKMMILKYLV